MNFDQLVDMVLQLVVLQLHQIVLTQYHVLDQLGDLLVELDDVGFLVHEVLDLDPLKEHRVAVGLLAATTETVDNLA